MSHLLPSVPKRRLCLSLSLRKDNVPASKQRHSDHASVSKENDPTEVPADGARGTINGACTQREASERCADLNHDNDATMVTAEAGNGNITEICTLPCAAKHCAELSERGPINASAEPVAARKRCLEAVAQGDSAQTQVPAIACSDKLPELQCWNMQSLLADDAEKCDDGARIVVPFRAQLRRAFDDWRVDTETSSAA
jgi:hypothetical protein